MTCEEMLEFLEECCKTMALETKCDDRCEECPFYNIAELIEKQICGDKHRKQ